MTRLKKAHPVLRVGLSKNGARGQPRRGTPTAQGVVAYGCTFRPDQVHNSPLRGTPPRPPRAFVMTNDELPNDESTSSLGSSSFVIAYCSRVWIVTLRIT